MNALFYEQLARWSQVAGSVVFIAVLVYVFVRFVSPAIISAQERKNAELEEAERRRDAAREEVTVAERELDTVSQYCEAIRERAVGDAERERQRIASDALAEGERVVRNAEGELDRARAGAREMLRHELLAKALQIARDAASRLDERENRRLVADVIDTVERSAVV
jgi:F0F1-type ATP synthase membrane subunit b/b'